MRRDIHIRVPVALLDELDGYCGWKHTSRTIMICQALKQLLDHAEQPQPGRWHP